MFGNILFEAANLETEAAQAVDRWDNVSKSLSIMGYGMAGIFVTIFIIMLVVWALGYKKKNNE